MDAMRVEEIRLRHEFTKAQVAKMFGWKPTPMQEDFDFLIAEIDHGA